ncbi:unnamed protein product [Paramecium pentaurelia]|uniref:ATP-dependent DNA ligase family profile domain-containing protein n=1 Tax=Paramecium pentaurelia TaxID=43138 RepID=A0A8S1T4I8_9CILI|nr:unnamed protein product [Paramecium pentaurelia]
MNSEIYLVKLNQLFWHSKLLSTNPVTLQIRSGNLNTNWEKSENLQIELKKYNSLQEGILDIGEMLKLKLRQGYHEIKSSEIVKIYEQINFPEAEYMYELDLKYKQFQQQKGLIDDKQLTKKEQIVQKIERKQKQPGLNYPEKSCSQLLDDATQGKLVSVWPKNKMRPNLGENLGLGPTFSTSQRISCLLAQNWTVSVDPKGYYMSEKLDGMRMIWTGMEMFTRNGYSLKFPSYFIEGWPTTYLDGELWINRGTFNKVLTSVRKRIPDPNAWKTIKYMVFDAPFLQEPFSDRYAKLKKAIEKIKNPHLIYLPHKICRGKEHLAEELAEVQNNGGEGLMLRDPDSLYEGIRSKSLLKVKSSLDAEAFIIDYIEDTHMKKQGILGGFLVRNDQGLEFEVGLGLKIGIKKQRPPIGTKITYKYCGLAENGYPKFPEFVRQYPQDI